MAAELSRILKIGKENQLNCFALYTYDLKKLPKSNAVRLVYLLKGREDSKGIVKEFDGYFLAPGCFLIPLLKSEEMTEILNKWGVKYKRRFILTS